MARVQQADYYKLINSFDSFFFDADGVLWLGDTPLPGAADFLLHLVSTGLCLQPLHFHFFQVRSNI